MITVTELATEKLSVIMQEEGQPESALRILVMPGPNGTPQYMLTLEGAVKDDDTVVHSNGVRVVVDSDSLPLMEGVEIDYVEGLMRSGFVINNPNIMMGGGGCGGGGGCACGGNCGCGGH